MWCWHYETATVFFFGVLFCYTRSFPVGLSSATQLVCEKEAMLDEMKASFGDKAEESMLSLSDTLERSAK